MPIQSAAPSLFNPLDWLKAKLQDFYTLPARIGALRTKGTQLASLLAQQGRGDAASQVNAAVGNLSTTESLQQGVQSKLSALFTELGKLGIRLPGMSGYDPAASELGIIPLAVLALGGAVAVAVYAVFRHYNAQEAAIQNVAKGTLSPADYERMFGGGVLGFNLGGVVTPLVWVAGIGLLAYLLLPKLLKQRSAA